MKKLLATTAFAMAISAGSAFAADLPSKKAPILPPPPPPPVWTGFYVGLNAGYSWGAARDVTFGYADSAAGQGFLAAALNGSFPARVSRSTDGFIGGGQIGYNYQFNDRFVSGVEADIQGVAADKGSALYVGVGPAYTQASRSLDYLGTVRGRLGYTALPNLLVYATGGLAYGQANLSQALYIPGAFAATSFSDTRVGWTVGGGAEWLFNPNWGAKIEYLYYDLGSVSTPAVYATGVASTATATTRFDGHVVRAGVNYHFNLFGAPAAPVVAKY